MGFYNFNPDVIRELQSPDPGDVLSRDGRNLASILSALEREHKHSHDRIIDLLSKVVPGIKGVEIKPVGKKTMIEFRQQVGTNKDPWRFPAENMSDGTLRALGVLTALFQSLNSSAARVPFVGIEEPEIAVHPGAAGILRDGLRLASKNTPIAVTSHSPDLLDDKDVTDNSILAVINQNGETKIGPLDEAGRTAIRDRLYTAGELLRTNQLTPDETILANISNEQMNLFAEFQPGALSKFLTAAESLRGKKGLPNDLQTPADPDCIRDAIEKRKMETHTNESDSRFRRDRYPSNWIY